MPSLCQTVHCACGKVKLAINSPSVLRLICYCKDCRGYYNTLNEMARSKGMEPQAKLDEWGGVDMTQIYPSEIKVLEEGQDHLTTCIVRTGSRQKLVYCTCCNTPMFRIGDSSALLNTNLLPADANKPNVRFRIIGRDAPKEEAAAAAAAAAVDKKPPMSWSVPFSFPFVMLGRMKKDLMTPVPLDMKDVRVLENFKQG